VSAIIVEEARELRLDDGRLAPRGPGKRASDAADLSGAGLHWLEATQRATVAFTDEHPGVKPGSASIIDIILAVFVETLRAVSIAVRDR
jgi:hypothetical protein